MSDEYTEIKSLPVNEEGAIVIHPGGGTDNITGTLPIGYFPVDIATGGLVLRLPPALTEGNMRTEVFDPNEDGKIDIAQLSGAEPTLAKGNLTGTTNRITVTGGTGAVIGTGTSLTLPQDIHTQATPTFDGVKLNTSPLTIPTTTGAAFYDEECKTWAINTGVSGVTLQVGQETHLLCINATGSTLNAGEVVYISGSNGEHPTIAKAANIDYSQANSVMGMLTSSPAHGDHCMVTVHGLVHDIDTAAYAPGTVLYLGSIAGTWTATKPTPENTSVRVGYVVKQHATEGEVFIDKQVEMNSAGSYLDVQLRATTQAVPTTPTPFLWPVEVADTSNMYDNVSGEFVIPFTGQFTFQFYFNCESTSASRQFYAAAQTYNGTTWGPSEFSTRQDTVRNGELRQVPFPSTNQFTAGTRLRFVVWCSANINLITTNVAVGYTVPAARLMITGVKTI